MYDVRYYGRMVLPTSRCRLRVLRDPLDELEQYLADQEEPVPLSEHPTRQEVPLWAFVIAVVMLAAVSGLCSALLFAPVGGCW